MPILKSLAVEEIRSVPNLTIFRQEAGQVRPDDTQYHLKQTDAYPLSNEVFVSKSQRGIETVPVLTIILPGFLWATYMHAMDQVTRGLTSSQSREENRTSYYFEGKDIETAVERLSSVFVESATEIGRIKRPIINSEMLHYVKQECAIASPV